MSTLARTISLDARPRQGQGLEGAPMRLPRPTFSSTAVSRITFLSRVEYVRCPPSTRDNWGHLDVE